MPRKEDIRSGTVVKNQLTRDIIRKGINSQTNINNIINDNRQIKESYIVYVQSDININLASLPANIDGVPIFDGMVFYASNQSVSAENDFYTVSGAEAFLLGNYANGNIYTIQNGTYQNRVYLLNNNQAFVRGVDDINLIWLNEFNKYFKDITSGGFLLTNATGIVQITDLDTDLEVGKYNFKYQLFIDGYEVAVNQINILLNFTGTANIYGSIHSSRIGGALAQYNQPNNILSVTNILNLGGAYAFSTIFIEGFIEVTTQGQLQLLMDNNGSGTLGQLIRDTSLINIKG